MYTCFSSPVTECTAALRETHSFDLGETTPLYLLHIPAHLTHPSPAPGAQPDFWSYSDRGLDLSGLVWSQISPCGRPHADPSSGCQGDVEDSHLCAELKV